MQGLFGENSNSSVENASSVVLTEKDKKKFKEVKFENNFKEDDLYYLDDDLVSNVDVVSFLVEDFKNSKLHHANIISGDYMMPVATIVYNMVAKMVLSSQMNDEMRESVLLSLRYCFYDDIYFLNADEKGLINVDAVRSLMQKISLKSVSGFKFVIINSINAMNNNACNALLKTLEEPSENTFFFIIDSQISRILPTIRSRCRFYKISNNSEFGLFRLDDLGSKLISEEVFYSFVFGSFFNNIQKDLITAGVYEKFKVIVSDVSKIANTPVLLNDLIKLMLKAGFAKNVIIRILQNLVYCVYLSFISGSDASNDFLVVSKYCDRLKSQLRNINKYDCKFYIF
jgi:hypothetical protein